MTSLKAIPLKNNLLQQAHLLIFMITMIYVAYKKIDNETVHKSIAVAISVAAVLSVILYRNDWIIK